MAKLLSQHIRKTLRVGHNGGLWRQGNLLLIHPMAIMPPICVLTGKQGYKSIYIFMRWVDTPVTNYPINLVPSYFTSNRKLTPWLCEEAYRSYYRRWVIKRTAFILSTLTIIASLTVLGNADTWFKGHDISMPAGITAIVAGLVWLISTVSNEFECHPLIPVAIYPSYALIEGVCEEFLARLEEYPDPLPELPLA